MEKMQNLIKNTKYLGLILLKLTEYIIKYDFFNSIEVHLMSYGI